MLDVRLIRERSDFVKAELAKLGVGGAVIDELLATDKQRRELITQTESLRAQRSETSRTIGKQAPEERERLKAAMRALGERIAALEKDLEAVESAFTSQMMAVPNLPDASVPLGQDDRDNAVLRTEGEPRRFDFEPKPHWDLGAALGILDFDRGVKVSGSRFYVLRGAGAALQRALIAWMLDLHTRTHGYTEIYPPALVKRDCLYGAGQLPKFEDNIYRDAEDDLYLVGTAEIPLTNLHRDEILAREQLPLSYVAYSPCFRREKMSAGRDVRGIKRGHQFDKVELYKLTEPAQSAAALEQILSDACDVARRLGIPSRIISICTGDLGFVAAKKYDIEMWAPGCGEWLEVSSCSNCTDFQARRANIRYRPTAGAKPEFVHTLNGSGLALPRVLIAVIENYQQADGSLVIPDVLRPFMGGRERIAADAR
jgi:seryl-tRNA synthetase